MGIILMFMLLSTVTPYLFLQLKKPAFAILQSILLVGMWLYYFEVSLFSAPEAFSFTWSMFYIGLFGAQVAWIMFIIAIVKESPSFKEEMKENL